MIYHVSPNAGLKTLYPHVSSHKKAYVYAIENFVTGLLFGVKQDDFDFCISTGDNGLTMVYECYPDAFKNIYQGKSCSVYVVDDEGFQRGLTSWSEELVCDKEVEVQNEIIVDDLYERLIEEELLGNIKIYRYEFNNDYRKKISVHVVDRLFVLMLICIIVLIRISDSLRIIKRLLMVYLPLWMDTCYSR